MWWTRLLRTVDWRGWSPTNDTSAPAWRRAGLTGDMQGRRSLSGLSFLLPHSHHVPESFIALCFTWKFEHCRSWLSFLPARYVLILMCHVCVSSAAVITPHCHSHPVPLSISWCHPSKKSTYLPSIPLQSICSVATPPFRPSHLIVTGPSLLYLTNGSRRATNDMTRLQRDLRRQCALFFYFQIIPTK